MILTTIILFLLILGAIVFIHELGHFLVAKYFGVKVDEFGLGFPPKIIGFKRGETEYTLNWIPLGGFVKIVGEDGEDKDDPRSFGSKSIGKRFLIISAGVIMNFFMAFVIFSLIFMAGSPTNIEGEDLSSAKSVGKADVRITNIEKDSPISVSGLMIGDKIISIDEKNITNKEDFQVAIAKQKDEKIEVKILRGKEYLSKEIIPSRDFNVVIAQVTENSPAFNAGLKKGDRILSIDDKEIYSIGSLQSIVNEKRGKTISISLIRENEHIVKEIIPRKADVEHEGPLGVVLTDEISFADIAIVKYSFLESIKKGFEYTVFLTTYILTAFFTIIKSLFTTGKTVAEVSGPIGIAAMTSQAASLGFIAVLNFMALICVNLAIINALPFPALDGGRLLFLIIEKIKGSPIKQKWEAKANNFGFLMLMLLMVVVTFQDLWKFDIWGRIVGLFE